MFTHVVKLVNDSIDASTAAAAVPAAKTTKPAATAGGKAAQKPPPQGDGSGDAATTTAATTSPVGLDDVPAEPAAAGGGGGGVTVNDQLSIRLLDLYGACGAERGEEGGNMRCLTSGSASRGPHASASSPPTTARAGFETFPDPANQRFASLLINYVNEKLQALYVQAVLLYEQQEYDAEGIGWAPVEYFDNGVIIDLFERKPGVFGLLDDMCLVGDGERAAWQWRGNGWAATRRYCMHPLTPRAPTTLTLTSSHGRQAAAGIRQAAGRRVRVLPALARARWHVDHPALR